jgi:hypothetical protein
MSRIIIILENTASAQLTVATDCTPPRVGSRMTPAESMAMDMLRLCKSQGVIAQYGADANGAFARESLAIELLRDLLHPEQLGHAVTAEVRARARACLGIPACETTASAASKAAA